MSDEHKDHREDANVTGHVEVADERVELGNQVFLSGFYIAMAVEAVGSVAGFGSTGSWAIALIGVLNVMIICSLASRLYDGDVQAGRYVKYVGPAFLLAAIVIAVVGEGSTWSIALAGQLAMPALFAFVATTRPARIFLASRRGESLDQFAVAAVEVIQEESILVKADQSITLRDEARHPVAQQVAVTRAVVGALGLCAGAGVILAGLSTRSLWLAFVLAVTGLAAIPLSFVLLTLADNWSFLTSTKGYEKAHLGNVARDIRVLSNCLIGAMTVLALLAILDVTMR